MDRAPFFYVSFSLLLVLRPVPPAPTESCGRDPTINSKNEDD